VYTINCTATGVSEVVVAEVVVVAVVSVTVGAAVVHTSDAK
jgi:hypothetical protein